MHISWIFLAFKQNEKKWKKNKCLPQSRLNQGAVYTSLPQSRLNLGAVYTNLP